MYKSPPELAEKIARLGGKVWSVYPWHNFLNFVTD